MLIKTPQREQADQFVAWPYQGTEKHCLDHRQLVWSHSLKIYDIQEKMEGNLTGLGVLSGEQREEIIPHTK